MKKQLLLIDAPRTAPTRKQMLAAWKKHYRVWTHCHKTREQYDSMRWCALIVPVGYRDNPVLAIGKYGCRLEDTNQMVNARTERCAVEALAVLNDLPRVPQTLGEFAAWRLQT